MEKNNSKYFFLLILFVVLIVVGYRYKVYIVDKNFILELNTICDAKTEKCFSPSIDLGFLETPYKKVSIVASRVPKCLEEHNCESFFCPADLENTDKCQITYCSDETKIEGEECLSQ